MRRHQHDAVADGRGDRIGGRGAQHSPYPVAELEIVDAGTDLISDVEQLTCLVVDDAHDTGRVDSEHAVGHGVQHGALIADQFGQFVGFETQSESTPSTREQD